MSSTLTQRACALRVRRGLVQKPHFLAARVNSVQSCYNSTTGRPSGPEESAANAHASKGVSRGLPAPEARQDNALDMSSGQGTLSLDHLGPIVVNRDGTVGRVGNWSEMTDNEKKATLELLRKRNQLRKTAMTSER